MVPVGVMLLYFLFGLYHFEKYALYFSSFIGSHK